MTRQHAIAFRPDTAPPPERRGGERVPLRRGALLELPGRRRTAVNLLDLSGGGAAVAAFGTALQPGMAVALVIDTVLLPAVVVAVSEGRAHLAFRPLPQAAEAALHRLLIGLREPALAS
ncbi:hypothetical protein GXW78_23465 [Roseomonas terrae]|jgi:hypothetical protein|uniref:PilZ domain-containing protein n=1 Tax=Neoroseomonas terrae TaxID=424799 RepID=A0ABS5ENN9_9PROT|nr:PilZ domain-containing protein [Neoroseomonas terrae]MBR0652636.1 hypothetical protein [Neoroseomonas terrae]